jgi:hypothetical protein
MARRQAARPNRVKCRTTACCAGKKPGKSIQPTRQARHGCFQALTRLDALLLLLDASCEMVDDAGKARGPVELVDFFQECVFVHPVVGKNVLPRDDGVSNQCLGLEVLSLQRHALGSGRPAGQRGWVKLRTFLNCLYRQIWKQERQEVQADRRCLNLAREPRATSVISLLLRRDRSAWVPWL